MDYDPKGMPFRRLGPTGLRVPVFSLGGWLTIGGTVIGDPVKDIIKIAFENGINMFDTAEGYESGRSEEEMGRVIKELGIKRSELVISTKLYFWGQGKNPNANGLSRKHIIEGTQASLKRLQMDYVDVIFAHRPDRTVTIEEVVRAFNYVIEKGWAFYWGTSEWSAREIEEAYHVADKLNLIPPVAEQCKHNMFHRHRPEGEYAPIFAKYGIGTTVFSALASGFLTGKYSGGQVPPGSRFEKHKDIFKNTIDGFNSKTGKKQFERLDQLTQLAEKELNCKIAHLALAWVAKQPSTSTVILGASRPEQVLDNLKALEVIPKLTPEIIDRIEKILENKPEPEETMDRPPLDMTFRAMY